MSTSASLAPLQGGKKKKDDRQILCSSIIIFLHVRLLLCIENFVYEVSITDPLNVLTQYHFFELCLGGFQRVSCYKVRKMFKILQLDFTD